MKPLIHSVHCSLSKTAMFSKLHSVFWFQISQFYLYSGSRFPSSICILVPDFPVLTVFWFQISQFYLYSGSRLTSSICILVPDFPVLSVFWFQIDQFYLYSGSRLTSSICNKKSMKIEKWMNGSKKRKKEKYLEVERRTELQLFQKNLKK